VVRAIHLVPLVIILLTFFQKDMSAIISVAIGLAGFVIWVLVLYFSRPVKYIGEAPIGPSRSARLLAPIILLWGAMLLIYVVISRLFGTG
jgi:hypothetical protein